MLVCFTADPFVDAADTDDSGKDYVHIRIQQRNGKKSLTTIQVCIHSLSSSSLMFGSQARASSSLEESAL